MFEVHRAKKKSGTYLALVLFGLGFLIAPSLKFIPIKLVWNASASVPKGLYRVNNTTLKKGDLVLVQLPEWAAQLANQRGYLPRKIAAMKHITGVQNDVVCRFGQQIFVSGMPSVKAKYYDNHGQKMPCWNGCKRIGIGEIFLLADHPASFDGRYFGVTKTINITGALKPIWLITD